MTTPTDIHSLDPGALVELFELDLREISGIASDRYFFHAGLNGYGQPVVWQGNTYQPFPVEASGFEVNSKGTLPRPVLKASNVTGILTSLILAYDDMIGAKVVRRRTFAKYLDEANFGPVRNLLKHSSDTGKTGWTYANGSVPSSTVNAVKGPDGEMTGDKFVASTAVGFHYIDQLVNSLADNAVVSASVCVKKAEVSRVTLVAYPKTGSGCWLTFRFDDEQITGWGVNNPGGAAAHGGNVKFGVEKLDHGWYRLKIENMSVLSGATVPRPRVFTDPDHLWGISGPRWVRWDVTASIQSDEVSPVTGWPVDLLVENTSQNTSHYVYLAGAATAGRRFRFTCYVKAYAGGAKRWLNLVSTGVAYGGNHGIVVDPSTGEVTAKTSQALDPRTEPVGGGWWKVSYDLVATANSFTGCGWQVRLGHSATALFPNYSGDGVSGLYVVAPIVTEVRDGISDVGSTPYDASGVYSSNGTDGVWTTDWQFELGPTCTSTQRTGAVTTSNINADPTQHLPDDVYYVERKVNENRQFVELELASAMDLQGYKLPNRVVTVGTCSWQYRRWDSNKDAFVYSPGSGCSYTGSSYFDSADASTAQPTNDSCSRTIAGCKARFGAKGLLPFGGFPAARAYKL